MQPANEQAIFYLQFVNAAYTMYECDRNNLTPPAQGFPDSDYKVITYLTSIDPASGSRVFFGFIAADSSANSKKPGILAIRGTDNFCEWLTDFDATPTPFGPFPGSYVATGFDEFVQGVKWISPDGDEVAIRPDVGAEWPAGLVVAGHSLGGAMATLLTATWIATIPSLLLTLVTAACPALGDYRFKTQFDAVVGPKSWRYINEFDVVASSLDIIYYQVNNGILLRSFDILPTPTCEHSLETYIWLLSPDGTPCTSNCCIFDESVKRRVGAVFEQSRRTAFRRA